MTDHKAEAEKLLDKEFQANRRNTELQCIAQAQVHATLYLAEQQRIANLIAKQIEMFTGLHEGERISEASSALHAQIEREIRKGLGL